MKKDASKYFEMSSHPSKVLYAAQSLKGTGLRRGQLGFEGGWRPQCGLPSAW